MSCLPCLQDGESEVGFEYRKQRLCWDDAAGVFKALNFPDNVSMHLSWCRLHMCPARQQRPRPHTSAASARVRFSWCDN